MRRYHTYIIALAKELELDGENSDMNSVLGSLEFIQNDMNMALGTDLRVVLILSSHFRIKMFLFFPRS